MVRKRRMLSSVVCISMAATGCGGDDETLQKAAPPAPTVVVATVESQTVPIMRDFVARTEAIETVEIRARVEALLEKIEFEEGRRVAKDQVLYRLDSRTYDADLSAAQARLAQADASLKLANEQVSVRAAEAALTRAKATLKKAQQDVARLRPLAEKDAVPRQDLDTALAAEEVTQAEVTAAEADLQNSKIQEEVGILLATAELQAAEAAVDLAKLNLEYCTITSPIEGRIGRTAVDVGNLVGRGEATQLASVSSSDPIYVTFAITEGEYLYLEKRRRERGRDARGEEPIELILSDDSVYEYQGKLVTAERAVDQQTGSLQVVGKFANPATKGKEDELGLLRDGQFARVRVKVQEVENAVLVPQRAVMEQLNAKVIYLVGENDVVSVRTIQIVERFEEYFIVDEGVEAGDRVIVEGQLKARPGSPVKPLDQAASSEPGKEGE